MEDFLHYTDCLDRRLSMVRQDGQLTEIVTSLFRHPYALRPDSMRLAILGDLHGHITLALETLAKWVDYSKLPFDAILQTGDFGVFDHSTILDKVTLEISEKDPDELGFKNYLTRSKEADRFFGRGGLFADVPLYFIDGNHDDIYFLERSERQVTAYPNILYARSGSTFPLQKGFISRKVTALGWHKSKRQVNALASQDVDILLTHSLLEDEDVLHLADSAKYHFFGHAHETAHLNSNPLKNSYGLNEVRMNSKEELRPCSMGLLDISEKDSLFIYLPQINPQ